MVRVKILAGEADEPVGDFEFEHLPRTGDEIGVPWPSDHFGSRYFTVAQVMHLAPGAPSRWGKGPMTILRYCEEIT